MAYRTVASVALIVLIVDPLVYALPLSLQNKVPLDRGTAGSLCPPGEPCGPLVLKRGSGGALTMEEGSLKIPVRNVIPEEWASRFGLSLLPGLASINNQSSIVTTSVDLRQFLHLGDLFRLGTNVTVRYPVGKEQPTIPADRGLFEVAGVEQSYIKLVSIYSGPAYILKQVFKKAPSATDFITRIHAEAEARQQARLQALEKKESDFESEEAEKAAEKEKLKAAEKRLQVAIADEMQTPKADETPAVPEAKLDASCPGGAVLPGTFDALHGSAVIRTSVDVRAEISEGEHIQFDGYPTRYAITQPRDNRTITLSSRYVDEDHPALTACKIPEADGVGCIPLSGCFDVIQNSHVVRTSVDIIDEIVPGEIIRLKAAEGPVEASVTNPRDGRTLTLSGAYPSVSANCIPACKVRNTWDGGLIGLCGNVSVTHGSPTVYTSCDLRDSLSLGDLVRIGAHTSPITSPFTDAILTLVTRYPDATASGLKASKQIREVPLSGTVSVVVGSVTVTTTSDLRDEIRPGDMLKIYQKPNHPDVFAVVAPMDAMTLTLARAHPGPSAFGLKAYKVAGTLNPLSGTCSVVKSSATVYTTMDLRGELLAGDTVQIDQFEGVVDTVESDHFVVDEQYNEETASELIAYKKGKSAEQSTLEQLAIQKLSCTSIYCLTKIEEAERALTFSYPRTLQGGLEMSGDTGMSGAGSIGDEDPAYEPSPEAEPSDGTELPANDVEATQLSRLRSITSRVAAQNRMQIPDGTDAMLKQMAKTSKVPADPADLKVVTVQSMNEDEAGEAVDNGLAKSTNPAFNKWLAKKKAGEPLKSGPPMSFGVN